MTTMSIDDGSGRRRRRRARRPASHSSVTSDELTDVQFPPLVSSRKAAQGAKARIPGFWTKTKGPFRFLDLPVEIRVMVYEVLLGSHPEHRLTFINYTLDWPNLQCESDFMCSCARPDKNGFQHTYVRHVCDGPRVLFSPSKELYVAGPPQGPSLGERKATDAEKASSRPGCSILRASRLIYKEALPFLYQGRTFHILDGTSSSRGLGRYQSYATIAWLKLLSEEARFRIEGLKVVIAPYEQDCELKRGRRSCADFCHFAMTRLPRLQKVEVELYNIGRPRGATQAFGLGLELVSPFWIILRREELHLSIAVIPWDFPQGLPHVIRNADNLARKRSEMVNQSDIDQMIRQAEQNLSVRCAKRVQRSQAEEDEEMERVLSNIPK